MGYYVFDEAFDDLAAGVSYPQRLKTRCSNCPTLLRYSNVGPLCGPCENKQFNEELRQRERGFRSAFREERPRRFVL